MGEVRSTLRVRLDARREEIERVALERVQALSDPTAVGDPQYTAGLRDAVSAAVVYGLDAVERGDDLPPRMPLALASQARLAARCGVTLDTVLRRYCAGHSLLGNFLVEEAEGAGVSGGDLKSVLRSHATLLDRILAAVSEEYLREQRQEAARTSEQHRVELFRRFLAGELIDMSSIAYDFDGLHVGVVGNGRIATEALHVLAASLNRRLLLVRPDENTVWAWFGGRRELDPDDLDAIVGSSSSPDAVLAFGEDGHGLSGWRLTHRQAAAARSVANASQRPVVRYADVALLASVAQDEVLATSLRQLYLDPLEDEHGDAEVAKETLRAYFEADRNVSSAAAALGENRNTVASRLRAIENRIGRRLHACAAELEAALGLDRLRPDRAPRAFVSLPESDG